jgi:hypothetical protein
VRVLDLRHPSRLRELVEKGARTPTRSSRASAPSAAPTWTATLALLERLAPRLLPLAEDVGLHVHRAVKGGAAVLLEGAQGSMLDVDHGTYPFVTSSSTTSGGAAVGVGIAPDGDRRRARRGEGVHDARRQRPAADRDGRRARRGGAPPRQRVRRDHGARAAVRLVRRRWWCATRRA